MKKSLAQFIEQVSDADRAQDKATMSATKRAFPLSKVYSAFMLAGETIKLPSKMR